MASPSPGRTGVKGGQKVKKISTRVHSQTPFESRVSNVRSHGAKEIGASSLHNIPQYFEGRSEQEFCDTFGPTPSLVDETNFYIDAAIYSAEDMAEEGVPAAESDETKPHLGNSQVSHQYERRGSKNLRNSQVWKDDVRWRSTSCSSSLTQSIPKTQRTLEKPPLPNKQTRRRGNGVFQESMSLDSPTTHVVRKPAKPHAVHTSSTPSQPTRYFEQQKGNTNSDSFQRRDSWFEMLPDVFASKAKITPTKTSKLERLSWQANICYSGRRYSFLGTKDSWKFYSNLSNAFEAKWTPICPLIFQNVREVKVNVKSHEKPISVVSWLQIYPTSKSLSRSGRQSSEGLDKNDTRPHVVKRMLVNPSRPSKSMPHKPSSSSGMLNDLKNTLSIQAGASKTRTVTMRRESRSSTNSLNSTSSSGTSSPRAECTNERHDSCSDSDSEGFHSQNTEDFRNVCFLIPPLEIKKTMHFSETQRKEALKIIGEDPSLSAEKEMSSDDEEVRTSFIEYDVPNHILEDVALVWLCCGGKDMLALDWLPFMSRCLRFSIFRSIEGVTELSLLTEKFQEKNVDPTRQFYQTHIFNRCAYILVEYPGYGLSEGTPTPERCVSTAVNALKEGLTELGLTHPVEVRIMGYSLGAAVALRVALELTQSSLHEALLPAESACVQGKSHWKRGGSLPSKNSFQKSRGSLPFGESKVADNIVRTSKTLHEKNTTSLLKGKYNLTQLVLVAPFTSTAECVPHLMGLPSMFRSIAGSFISKVQDPKTKWNNVDSLARLVRTVSQLNSLAFSQCVYQHRLGTPEANPDLASDVEVCQKRLKVHILHGTADNVVPFEMGKKLFHSASLLPGVTASENGPAPNTPDTSVEDNFLTEKSTRNAKSRQKLPSCASLLKENEQDKTKSAEGNHTKAHNDKRSIGEPCSLPSNIDLCFTAVNGATHRSICSNPQHTKSIFDVMMLDPPPHKTLLV